MTFSYVYLLVSETEPEPHYVGRTDDLKDRLRRHNAGEVAHTRKRRPWTVQAAVAFNGSKKAPEFEAYLKSHSAEPSPNAIFDAYRKI
jgi:predicted GIY-YIG superfamily endonuclease